MEATTATPVGALADRYAEAWRSHDLDAIVALHTEDAVFQLHVPGSTPVTGREAIRAVFDAFIAQIPDIRFEQRRLHTGDAHWVLESTLSGTPATAVTVDGEQLDPSGAAVEVDCIDVIEVRDGLVARKDTYLDAISFQRQMGVS